MSTYKKEASGNRCRKPLILRKAKYAPMFVTPMREEPLTFHYISCHIRAPQLDARFYPKARDVFPKDRKGISLFYFLLPLAHFI